MGVVREIKCAIWKITIIWCSVCLWKVRVFRSLGRPDTYTHLFFICDLKSTLALIEILLQIRKLLSYFLLLLVPVLRAEGFIDSEQMLSSLSSSKNLTEKINSFSPAWLQPNCPFNSSSICTWPGMQSKIHQSKGITFLLLIDTVLCQQRRRCITILRHASQILGTQ